jgi:hypothetical protein
MSVEAAAQDRVKYLLTIKRNGRIECHHRNAQSMIITAVNPHRHGLPGAEGPRPFVKFHRGCLSRKHVLVKP